MPRGGRRPGNQDTRAAILAAARSCFTEEGYEQASLRGIARRAGVDPALVHHYFAGKPEIFVEVLHLGRDPREIATDVGADPTRRGARLIREFLTQFEAGAEDRNAAFISLVQAVSASTQAADGLREFLVERVWSVIHQTLETGDADLRRAMVSSQLFGVAWDRYILRLEPFASATVDQVAEWMGPFVDAAMNGGVAPDPTDVSGARSAART